MQSSGKLASDAKTWLFLTTGINGQVSGNLIGKSNRIVQRLLLFKQAQKSLLRQLGRRFRAAYFCFEECLQSSDVLTV